VSQHVAEYLPEMALGVLDDAQRDHVQRHLSECPTCAAWLAELRESCLLPSTAAPPEPQDGSKVITVVAPNPLPKEEPATGVVVHRFRDHRVGGLLAFAARIADLFGVMREESERLLTQVEGRAPWQAGPAPSLQVLEVNSPLSGTQALILKAVPGAVFPRHSHTGDEQTLVLQGAFQSNGVTYWRGDRLIQREGSVHALLAASSVPALCALRIRGKLNFT